MSRLVLLFLIAASLSLAACVSKRPIGDQPDAFGDGPMTLETSPNRIHAVITYLDQTIEVWLVRLPAA